VTLWDEIHGIGIWMGIRRKWWAGLRTKGERKVNWTGHEREAFPKNAIWYWKQKKPWII